MVEMFVCDDDCHSMFEDGKQLVDMVYLKKEKIFHHTMRLPIILYSQK